MSDRKVQFTNYYNEVILVIILINVNKKIIFAKNNSLILVSEIASAIISKLSYDSKAALKKNRPHQGQGRWKALYEKLVEIIFELWLTPARQLLPGKPGRPRHPAPLLF
jgi:hypothetical protein